MLEKTVFVCFICGIVDMDVNGRITFGYEDLAQFSFSYNLYLLGSNGAAMGLAGWWIFDIQQWAIKKERTLYR